MTTVLTCASLILIPPVDPTCWSASAQCDFALSALDSIHLAPPALHEGVIIGHDRSQRVVRRQLLLSCEEVIDPPTGMRHHRRSTPSKSLQLLIQPANRRLLLESVDPRLGGHERRSDCLRPVCPNAAQPLVTVGLFDSLGPLVATTKHGLTAPGGPLAGGLPTYAIYPTREGLVAIGALEPHFRARLYAVLQLPDGADLGEVMTSRTAQEWEVFAEENDLPISVIRRAVKGD